MSRNGCENNTMRCQYLHHLGGYCYCLANDAQRKMINGLNRECAYFLEGFPFPYKSKLEEYTEDLKKPHRERATAGFEEELDDFKLAPILEKKKEQERKDCYDKLLEDD